MLQSKGGSQVIGFSSHEMEILLITNDLKLKTKRDMSNRNNGIMRWLYMFFGIFMVLIYLGVAWLMAINYFGFPRYLSWFFAVMFGIYGLYRGYREVTGEPTYGMRRRDDEEPEYQSYSDRLKQLENKDNDEYKK